MEKSMLKCMKNIQKMSKISFEKPDLFQQLKKIFMEKKEW